MHSNLRLYLNTPLLLFFFLFTQNLQAQFRILLYTETGGYNHGTEAVAKTLIDSLGTAHNFSVDLDNTGDRFSILDSLLNYKVVIWANTSGANILDSTQRAHFEQYMAAGGNMMGIHAATDTYRHSSANGGWTGEWDYYAETLGASVQTSPNHTWNLHANYMDHQTTHTALDSLPNPWYHAEEYYYWENGYFDSTNNHVLLKVRETDRGGTVNSYDSARAVSWIKDNPGGGKVFYTALGHNKSSYQSDPYFKIHIRDAILALTAAPPPVLGISWLDLKLNQDEEGNTLSWSVESSEILGSFLIQRKNERGAWQEIAQLPSKDSENQRYFYTDTELVQGKGYYRIAFLDLEGELSYSQILESESTALTEISLANPVKQDLDLFLESHLSGFFELEIININGTSVIKDQFFKEQVETRHVYKMGHLPPGIYLLKISTKDVNFTRRILKI